MPKRLYCSYCGMELEHSPKAFKNRGEILHLVNPHDCDEKYVDNITDAEKPQSALAKEIADRERSEAASREEADNNLFPSHKDIRDKDHLRKPITSTAPMGVLGQVGSGQTSGAERKMVDLDEGKGSDNGED